MTDRDKRLVEMIDRVAQSVQTAADRAYLVASLAYGNVALEDPHMPAFRGSGEPRQR